LLQNSEIIEDATPSTTPAQAGTVQNHKLTTPISRKREMKTCEK